MKFALKTIYIVSGTSFGDYPISWPVVAYDSKADAESHVAALKKYADGSGIITTEERLKRIIEIYDKGLDKSGFLNENDAFSYKYDIVALCDMFEYEK